MASRPANRPTPAALRALARRDPALGAALRRVEPFPGFPRPAVARRPHYEHLARAIVYQQLSGKAAGTIWGRACALTPGRGFPRPAELLALDAGTLRAAGLSRQKQGYLRGLAEAVESGTLATRGLARLPDDAVVERLVPLPGVGVWTAQMFLIFKLGRLDVLPTLDLGVQEGLRRLDGAAERPRPAEVEARGAAWAPLRSVASWVLWRLTETPPPGL